MSKPQVVIVMGSASDLPVMEEAGKALAELGIEAETHVASAHRTPEKASKLAREAQGRGIKVIIAGAGMAAHLAGAMGAAQIGDLLRLTLQIVLQPVHLDDEDGGAVHGEAALDELLHRLDHGLVHHLQLDARLARAQ